MKTNNLNLVIKNFKIILPTILIKFLFFACNNEENTVNNEENLLIDFIKNEYPTQFTGLDYFSTLLETPLWDEYEIQNDGQITYVNIPYKEVSDYLTARLIVTINNNQRSYAIKVKNTLYHDDKNPNHKDQQNLMYVYIAKRGNKTLLQGYVDDERNFITTEKISLEKDSQNPRLRSEVLCESVCCLCDCQTSNHCICNAIGGCSEIEIIGEQTVSLILNSTIITLNDFYGITVSYSGNGTIGEIQYESMLSSEGKIPIEIIYAGTHINHLSNLRSTEPGTFYIKATVFVTLFTSGYSIAYDIETPTVTITIQYPNVNTIKNNIASKLNSIWQETKNATLISGRQEKGFWVYLNTNTVGYEYSTTINGSIVTCGEQTSISPGSYSDTGMDGSLLTEGKNAVAFVRTHPPLTYCSSVNFRVVGATAAEIEWANSIGIPNIVYDYSGEYYSSTYQYLIYGGHGINNTAQTYTFGPTRRATP
jgi:hypothetical protein